MQFKVSTDNAIRIVYYLSKRPNEFPTGMEIAEEMGISYPLCVNVLNKLKEKGLMNSVLGRGGGFTLERPANEITIYDIIVAMEGGIRINRCLSDGHFCTRNATSSCPVHKVFSRAQSNLINELNSVYISDL